MSEIPEDIFATARTLADSVSFGGYEINTLAIARAIRAERERCASVANSIATDVRNSGEQRITAGKIVALITSGIHPDKSPKKKRQPEAVE